MKKSNGVFDRFVQPIDGDDTRLDTIVGILAVLFAVIATAGWMLPALWGAAP